MAATARKTQAVNPPSPAAQRAALVSRIEATRRERDLALAFADELDAKTDDVLRTGDDTAAEGHEQQIARHRRAGKRAELLLAELEPQLIGLDDAIRAEEAGSQRDAADRAVDEIISAIKNEYDAPAAIIADFMRRWTEAQRMARAAGVDGPDEVMRSRRIAEAQPAEYREEDYLVFVDAYGRDTADEYEPDESGIIHRQARYRRRQERRTRQIKVADARPEVWHTLQPLEQLVCLPGATIGDEWHVTPPLLPGQAI
jgi:hypothetical protein